MSGEGADELFGGYLYFHNAPSKEAFRDETVRLMEDIAYFDVLRCDKSTAGAGLEVRVPFLDKDFMEYYMNVDPELKRPKEGKMEKNNPNIKNGEVVELVIDKVEDGRAFGALYESVYSCENSFMTYITASSK